MRTGRPKIELLLTDEERSQLQSFARSRSLPGSLSMRAHIVLSSAEGELNSSIAERLKLTKATVGKRRIRFIERRIPGLYDDVRPGKTSLKASARWSYPCMDKLSSTTSSGSD